ncbi:DUF6248 family natural product biosynthesis protein [Streptomyces sp. NPDC001904]|uniref:DUF6248 family natural product biosynthesis protein n=1 Tax=Streptomyces sp. NPDC001904 TaxID=3154531 RepID=UPI0033189204
MTAAGDSARSLLLPDTYVRLAHQAAAAAVAAADSAMEAACRTPSDPTSGAGRLEEAMHAAHAHACEAERFALWTAQWDADETHLSVLANYTARAIDAAVRAQESAGSRGADARELRALMRRPLSAEERAERERAARRQEAADEEAARSATGMDSDNRRQAELNRFLAEETVAGLGWTPGHVRVLEAAAAGGLYWHSGQARCSPVPGTRTGGRKVSRERTEALFAMRFLSARRHKDGSRSLTLSPMGCIALKLARLQPQGLFADECSAYAARYARAARSWMSGEEKKSAGRRLVPLDRIALRLYRQPVTLVEQEQQVLRDASQQWEDEGGLCPGVQTPRPAAAADATPAGAAAEPGTPHPPAPAGRDDGAIAAVRRPQRVLSSSELRVVHETSLLNLHGALLMGIVDPVANPSAMSEAEGDWVRSNVWPEHLKTIDRKYPWGFYRWSTCERGTCWNCLAGRCDWCVDRQQGGPNQDDNTGWLLNQHGFAVAKHILRPGGERCIWWCRCACDKTGALARRARVPAQSAGRAEPPEPAAPDQQELPGSRTQLPLF